MKRREPIQIFSLSFLDIISCAFGAVVMLILLAKNGEQGEYQDASQVATLIRDVNSAEQSVSVLQQALSAAQEQLKAAQALGASNADQEKALETQVARAKDNVQQLTDTATGLEQTLIERERAAINAGSALSRDDEVGGIPVDSDYVVFIIDTSGSMKTMWPRVLRTLDEVLNNHPKVEGFQVLSDNGDVLGGSRLGTWRKDSKAQRNGVLRGLQGWNGSSNSSPVEGIEAALRAYSRTQGNLALYVFGDDFTGSSYDSALAQINNLNRASSGALIARIHGIAFKRNMGASPDMVKFSTLMREVARQNNGTFMGL
ncbi:vWA domain-containing protein [Pseudoalteromonas sp. GB56]